LSVARQASDAVIVVVFCDGGEKYLTERFWDEAAGPANHLRQGSGGQEAGHYDSGGSR